MLIRKFRTPTAALPFVLVSGLLSGCSSDGKAAPSASTSATASASAWVSAQASAEKSLGAVAQQFHARLGVYILDTGTGRSVTYQADSRFAFCSTYKALATAVLLKRDTDAQLDQLIAYNSSDLVDYSPITSQHVGTGMTLHDIMAAALQYSDNTAANLLLDQLGGPAGLQAALRGLGDPATNVDDNEPNVNTATPGAANDTTTPRAIGTDLREFVLGDALPAGRRQMLTTWLLGNTTGGPYIRAGVPAGWTVGDKTGNGGYGTRNDIAVVWPLKGAPIVVALLSDRGVADANSDDALLADATKAGLAALG